MAIVKGGKPFNVYTKDNKFIGTWLNQAQCCKDLNLKSKGHISNCLHGRRKSYKGYIFKHK